MPDEQNSSQGGTKSQLPGFIELLIVLLPKKEKGLHFLNLESRKELVTVLNIRFTNEQNLHCCVLKPLLIQMEDFHD